MTHRIKERPRSNQTFVTGDTVRFTKKIRFVDGESIRKGSIGRIEHVHDERPEDGVFYMVELHKTGQVKAAEVNEIELYTPKNPRNLEAFAVLKPPATPDELAQQVDEATKKT